MLKSLNRPLVVNKLADNFLIISSERDFLCATMSHFTSPWNTQFGNVSSIHNLTPAAVTLQIS